MVRILITYVIPLVLPSLIYFAWTAWVRKQIAAKHAQAALDATEAGTPDADTITPEEVAAYEIRTPWFRLILAGAVLVVISLVLSVFFTPKNPPNSVYQPPYTENGKVMPGKFVPQDPNAPAKK